MAFIFLSDLPPVVPFPILTFAFEMYSGSFAHILHLRQLFNGPERYKRLLGITDHTNCAARTDPPVTATQEVFVPLHV